MCLGQKYRLQSIVGFAIRIHLHHTAVAILGIADFVVSTMDSDRYVLLYIYNLLGRLLRVDLIQWV